MKQPCFMGHRTFSNSLTVRVGAALPALLLAVFFVFCVDGAVLSRGSAFNNCATTDECKACAVGQPCCKVDNSCMPFDATTCAGTKCNEDNQCTDANVCKRIKAIVTPADCGSADTKCTCKVGEWCCKDDGACFPAESCAGTCSVGGCTSDNVCKTVAITPHLNPSPCTTSDTKCSCPESTPTKQQWCCKDDGACFDPNVDQTCAGSCKGAGCTLTGVCKQEAAACPTWTHTLTFTNGSSETIWIAAIPGCWDEGTVHKCHPVPEPGGWELAAKVGTATVQVPGCWSGGFVFRTNCTFDVDPCKNIPPEKCTAPKGQKFCTKGSPCCATGDCRDVAGKSGRSAFLCGIGGEPPASRIEMTFDGGRDKNGKPIGGGYLDYYDISFVNGWTKMITMAPTGSNFDPEKPPADKDISYWCRQAGCDKAPVCPAPLAFTDTVGKATNTYCWAPVGLSGTVHAKDASFSVTYKDQTTTYTNDNAFKSRLGCVCDSLKPTTCADPPESKTINPACSDPTGTKDYYGCSPFNEPGKSHTYSRCCPWSKDQGKDCGWDATVANEKKRIWPAWAQDYILNIKAVCQKAYTWQFDDVSSTYTCVSKDLKSAVNYQVTIYDGGQTVTGTARTTDRYFFFEL